MKKLSLITTGILIALSTAIVFSVEPAAAQSAVERGVQAAQGAGVPAELFGDGGIVTTITNVLLFIAGALAVIMLIFGGLRYTVSGGNASAVTAAKNTIMYAIIGLIVAFLAFAIVNWVLGAITPGSGGGSGFSNL